MYWVILMNFEKANSINFNEEMLIKTEYPEITVNSLPQDILMKLKRVYAGNKSEFTSMTQYIYQHFVLWSNPKLNNISHIMEEIGIKEMIHYEIIAKILVKCGIDPKNCVYIDGNPNVCDYWKASYVDYDKQLIKMFESNIALEQRGINAYDDIISSTDNENLKEILLRIVQDEVSHIIYFNAVLEALKN